MLIRWQFENKNITTLQADHFIRILSVTMRYNQNSIQPLKKNEREFAFACVCARLFRQVITEQRSKKWGRFYLSVGFFLFFILMTIIWFEVFYGSRAHYAPFFTHGRHMRHLPFGGTPKPYTLIWTTFCLFSVDWQHFELVLFFLLVRILLSLFLSISFSLSFFL